MNYLTKKVKISDIAVEKDRIRDDLGDLKALAMDIYKHGLLNPIIISADNKLIAGERRLTACRDHLGWTEIEARVPSPDGTTEVSDLLNLEIEIAENAMRKALSFAEEVREVRDFHRIAVKASGATSRGRTGGWTLRDTAAALNRSVGFVSQALQLAEGIAKNPKLAEMDSSTKAFKEMKRAEAQAAQIEVVEVAKSVGFSPEWIRRGENPGDMKTLESGKFQLIHMDPPYAIGYDKGKEIQATWGDVYEVPDIPHEIFETLAVVMRESFRLLKEGGSILCWYHMRHHSVICSMMRDAGFDLNPVPWFWCKDRHGGGISNRSHSNAVEPCLHGWKGQARPVNKPGQLNWHAVPKVPDTQKVHPTEKPVRLFYPLLENLTNEGEWCYDPYAGSFSFVRAAVALRRNAIGTEMKKDYCDGAVVAMLRELENAGGKDSSGERSIEI